MRSLPLLSFLLLCSIASCAQVRVIPKFGVSMSTASFTSDIAQQKYVKNKFGFVGGVGLSVYASKRFDFQPEILFHQKGWKYEGLDSLGSGEQTFTLNYLEIPVVAKVKFGPFYFSAGPSVAFGLGGHYEYHTSFGSSQTSGSGRVSFGSPVSNTNSTDFYIGNSIDFGLQLGAGVFIAHHVVIDLRYGLGLNNMFRAHYATVDQDSKSKLRSLQLTVGIPLRL